MTNIKENKMAATPIKKLLITMSVPMMLSMLVQALYNIVDSIFVAQLSENALTAVSLAFPVQNLMISIGSGTAIGVNALLSRSLGAHDFDKADSAAKHGLLLAFVSYIIFFMLGLTLSDVFYHIQTDIEEIAVGGIAYLRICTVLSFGMFGQIMCERLLVSTGKTLLSMTSQLTGAVINIILDPIMIFGLFSMPALGVSGAAYATVIGQMAGFAVALILNIKSNHEIHLSFKGFKLHFETVKSIYAVGIPSIIMMSISSLMVFILNKILMVFTSTAVAVFGIYFKLQSFIFMPVFGFNNGMVPIIAYNYGAQSKARIIETVKYAMLYVLIIMFIGIAIFQFIPDMLLMMFDAADEMLSIGMVALRIISIGFVFAGYGIVLSSVFQALGNGIASMIVSIIRQLIVLVPVAYLLSLSGNVNYIWWCFPIAETASVAASTYFITKIYKKTIKPLGA